MTKETEQQLAAGLQQLGVDLSAVQVALLLQYLTLFEKWNRAYNLSAIRKRPDMVRLHLLDSLAVAPHLVGEHILDVGTGAGLPGIPLAIAFPEKRFTLLDSAGKKTRFLFQVVQQLGLTNVAIENRRVESHQPELLYDGVISRAFASLRDMTQNCEHLLADSGRFWAMKGTVPEREMESIAEHFNVEHCHLLAVPGVDAQRCLLVLQRRAQAAEQGRAARV